MSRSGYTDDGDNPGLWRGMVTRSIRGKRGQAALKDLLAALDAMPVKALIAEQLEERGEFCTLGALGHAKGVDMSRIDVEDDFHANELAEIFNIAPCLVQEIEYMNDEYGAYAETPEQRWARMREWVASQLATQAQS